MNEMTPPPTEVERPSTTLVTITAVLLVINMLLARAIGWDVSEPSATRLGRMLGPVLVALVVVGIARLIGRGKTRRAQFRIVMWTMVVVLLGQCVTFANRAAKS